MALQNTDNFLVSRAGTSHKLSWSDLTTDINGAVPLNDAFITIGDPVTAVQSIVPYQAVYGIQLPVAGVNDYNISGALRYNSVASKIELYNGTDWITASGSTSFSSTPPSPASEGDIWYDVDDGRSYVYYNDGDSSQWVEMSPSWNGGIPPEVITPEKISPGGIQWNEDGKHAINTPVANGTMLKVNSAATGSDGIQVISDAGYDSTIKLNEGTTDAAFTFTQTSTENRISSSASLPINIKTIGTQEINLQTNSVSRIIVKGNGNIGFGVTTPTQNYDFYGESTRFNGGAFDGRGLAIRYSVGNNRALLCSAHDGDPGGDVGSTAIEFNWDDGTTTGHPGELRFRTLGSINMKLDSSGTFISNGDLEVNSNGSVITNKVKGDGTSGISIDGGYGTATQPIYILPGKNETSGNRGSLYLGNQETATIFLRTRAGSYPTIVKPGSSTSPAVSLIADDITSGRTLRFPNKSGTIALINSTQTYTAQQEFTERVTFSENNATTAAVKFVNGAKCCFGDDGYLDSYLTYNSSQQKTDLVLNGGSKAFRIMNDDGTVQHQLYKKGEGSPTGKFETAGDLDVNGSGTSVFSGTVNVVTKLWQKNAEPDYNTSGLKISSGKVTSVGSSAVGAIFGNTNSSGYNSVIQFVGGGSSSGYGQLEASATGTPRLSAQSDRRIKKNIRPASSQFGLFKALKFREYTVDYPELIDDVREDVLGLVADEVQEVLPYIVTGEPNAVKEDGTPDYQTVAYTELTIYNSAAIQELILKVEELEGEKVRLEAEANKVPTLEAKIKLLEEKMDKVMTRLGL